MHALTYNISAVSVIALYFSDCNNAALFLRRFLECMPALIATSSVVCAQSHEHIYTSPLLTARSLACLIKIALSRSGVNAAGPGAVGLAEVSQFAYHCRAHCSDRHFDV